MERALIWFNVETSQPEKRNCAGNSRVYWKLSTSRDTWPLIWTVIGKKEDPDESMETNELEELMMRMYKELKEN